MCYVCAEWVPCQCDLFCPSCAVEHDCAKCATCSTIEEEEVYHCKWCRDKQHPVLSSASENQGNEAAEGIGDNHDVDGAAGAADADA